MGKDRLTEPQDRLEQFLQHLEEARQLQRDWMTYGLDCVDIYFEDIDGDWLEKWGEDEQTQQTPTESLIAFLQSDDWVAVRVRKQLIDKPISEIAAKLEKYMSFPQAEDRIFAVKNLLTARAHQWRELPGLQRPEKSRNGNPGFSDRTTTEVGRNVELSKLNNCLGGQESRVKCQESGFLNS
ncbi:MAG: hypothetical protein HEQ35_18840 [Gloeotrichia echinulata IR180]